MLDTEAAKLVTELLCRRCASLVERRWLPVAVPADDTTFTAEELVLSLLMADTEDEVHRCGYLAMRSGFSANREATVDVPPRLRALIGPPPTVGYGNAVVQAQAKALRRVRAGPRDLHAAAGF